MKSIRMEVCTLIWKSVQYSRMASLRIQLLQTSYFLPLRLISRLNGWAEPDDGSAMAPPPTQSDSAGW